MALLSRSRVKRAISSHSAACLRNCSVGSIGRSPVNDGHLNQEGTKRFQSSTTYELSITVPRRNKHKQRFVATRQFGRIWGEADIARTPPACGCEAIDAVDGAHSAASKCHRVVASKRTTLRGAVQLWLRSAAMGQSLQMRPEPMAGLCPLYPQ